MKLKILAELTKIRITIFVTVTMLFGFISASGELNWSALLPTLGILLLACGSAVINHYQERETDALMNRTKNRPIPSGRISPVNALMTAIVLLSAGSLMLYIGAGLLALGLGLLNLVWYNGIYTPLKKVNPLAIIPGSLVGAIPPAVGWVAAGGSILDPQILIISSFFFIWQIPHFWLLLLVLDKDYERAGFPTLTRIFNPDQLARITFTWIAATVVTCLMIPLFGTLQSPFVGYGLFLAGIWLVWNSFKLVRFTKERIYFTTAFREINIFAILVVLLLSLDKLIIIF
ncbi:MAG TPA: protoheme IX farnesyltransferase [Ignavibacteriaceae bacterium]|nr:protoheme IX farnesyltransferase [Ignavibacteriaceae bacterium]